MKDFYKEHKGYRKLKKKLVNINPALAIELVDVVGAAREDVLRRSYEKQKETT